MFSRFFIDRPIFAAVLSIFLVLAGLSAMRTLPIAQYPEIAPPVVTVTAIYPGASAEVIEQTVAAPLENQINGVEHMLYMNSTSTSNGTVQIQITFDIVCRHERLASAGGDCARRRPHRIPRRGAIGCGALVVCCRIRRQCRPCNRNIPRQSERFAKRHDRIHHA